MTSFTKKEHACFKKLRTPSRIQDFLDHLPINHEKQGETCLSPRMVLQMKKAHCLEGALFAATALSLQGEPPLILNLKTRRGDQDHAVALYKRNGYWGAISKTNHAVLRFRDPIYASIRELALSYFHEYFLYKGGLKTLRAYSDLFDLNTFGTGWMTSPKDLWHIADCLASSPHTLLIPKGMERMLRPASRFERVMLEKQEWDQSNPRT